MEHPPTPTSTERPTVSPPSAETRAGAVGPVPAGADRRRFDRGRWCALAICLACTGAVIAAIPPLVSRIRAYHAVHSYLQPVFDPITGEEAPVTNTQDRLGFVWRDRPVLLEGAFDEAGGGHVLLTYGERSMEIPVGVALQPKLPLMARVEDWLRVLLFHVPREDDDLRTFMAEVTSGKRLDDERLVIVTRIARPGYAAERFRVDANWGWGETQRANWLFRFYELLPDGEIRIEEKRYPDSETKRMYAQARAELEGQPAPERAPDELDPRSWQHYAALRVMRPGTGPKSSGTESALSVVGWTLPTIAFGGLAGAVSLAFVFAPPRRKV